MSLRLRIKRFNLLLLFLFPLVINAQPFITTWKTDNTGSTTTTQIEIPTTGTGYDYNITWTEIGNPTHTGTLLSQTTNAIIEFGTPGTYRVEITGLFPRIFFNAGSIFNPQKDSKKILTIEQWGSIAWTSMASAFAGCSNLTINASDKPNLAGVTDMSGMFYNADAFNSDINSWDVSTITNMSSLFRDADSFNQPLNNWDVSNVTNMNQMFYFTTVFNQPIGNWNVGSVVDMSSMFAGAYVFNQPIGSWNVSSVQFMGQTFSVASNFNQDISGWDVSNVTDMSGLFSGSGSFNQDISGWDVSNVTNMASMFYTAIAFNADISAWDVSSVTNMGSMFGDLPTFNQDISGWDVSNVSDMRGMFDGATAFNRNLNGWDVSSVFDMNSMFSGAASFNQDISGWNVSNVSDMRGMFFGATSFNQDLSGWDVSKVGLMYSMLDNSGLSIENYDKLLIAWSALPLKSNVQFGASGLFYCTGESARAFLISNFNWFINDDGQGCIAVFQVNSDTNVSITNGQATPVDIGSGFVGAGKTQTFSIENKLAAPVTNLAVSFSGTVFSAVSVPTTIGGNTSITFDVNLSGAAAGTFMETLFITSDNFTAPFQFPITGVITATSEPEIAVFEGGSSSGVSLLNGQPFAYYIGEEFRGNNTSNQITIVNKGSAPLIISDISITGTAFSQASSLPITIPSGNIEVINITLSGLLSGLFFETLTITSNDVNEAAFNFDINGQIYGPEIGVFDGLDWYSDPEITNGQSTAIDFGSIGQGTDITRPLLIANFGPVNLAISSLSISGTAFTLASTPPTGIAATIDGIVSEERFDLILSGATAGTFTETVTIINDDDTNSTFTFQITGTILGGVCVNPPTAFIGSISDTCENNPIALSGSIGGAATSSVWTTSGDGVFSDATSLTSSYTAGATDIINGIVTFTLTTNDPDGAGACVSASTTVTVTINKTATVNVGSDLTICPTDVVNLSAVVGGSANNLFWTTSGTGTFGDNTAATTTYTPNVSDVSLGVIELTLSADAVGVCPQVSDKLTVAIPQPITAVNLSQNVNVQEAFVTDVIASSTINSTDVIAVSILQNGTKGIASINADKTISYLANTGTVGSDSFQYRICNQCNLCSDGTVTLDIANTPPVISQPSLPISVVIGQMITIPFVSLVSDLNDNVDLSSIQVIQGPTSNAIATFDSGFNLSLDYSNVSFVGTDQITIQVCDLLNDCSQITLQVEVEGEIIAYNGISPNGDGKNDYFLIENIQYLGPDNTVKIFNRWGDKVFEMKDYNNTTRIFDGKELPSGVYFYKVNYIKSIVPTGTSSSGELTGYLTLKR
jgi:gliding motility-associated-like protein